MIKRLIVFTIVLSVLAMNSCRFKSDVRGFETLQNELKQITGDVIFGDDVAPKTVYMYASYHCDFCRYFFSRTYPGLKADFLDNGKLKLVVKWVDFQENQQIAYALQAASCIGRFGVYEKYHQLLLVNPEVVFTEDFAQLIDDIMKDNPEIAQCILENNDYEYLRNNVKEFRENNLDGTPTFVFNNHAYSGFISYENFVKLLKNEFNIQ